MKYDDATWHSEGDFPEDLPPEAGATHSGMFLAWAILHELGGDIHVQELPESLQSLQDRSVTPGRFLLNNCDGKFTDEDLNEEGNRFAADYFDLTKGHYLIDYQMALGEELPSPYHVPDTWESYDRLCVVLDERLKAWRQGG